MGTTWGLTYMTVGMGVGIHREWHRGQHRVYNAHQHEADLTGSSRHSVFWVFCLALGCAVLLLVSG